jgi:hypothetical protein
VKESWEGSPGAASEDSVCLFILFYFIYLFYFILFYFILFYFILFYFFCIYNFSCNCRIRVYFLIITAKVMFLYIFVGHSD